MRPDSTGGSDSDSGSEHKEPVQKDFGWYLPLYKATLAADWEAAQKFFEKDKDAISAKVNQDEETILHLAVERGNSHIHFVEKLVEALPKEALSLKDHLNFVPLATAAYVGNTAAARILVKKDPDSVYSLNKSNQYLPLNIAALMAEKDTLSYLLSVTKEDAVPSPYKGRWGYELLTDVIIAGFYGLHLVNHLLATISFKQSKDIALDLVQRYPKLVTTEMDGLDSPLFFMARNASDFPSGCQLNFWQRFVYSGLRVNLEKYSKTNDGGDVEKAVDKSELANKNGDTAQKRRGNYFSSVCERLHCMVSEGIGSLVPHIKQKKLVHQQALQLVKAMCDAIKSTNHDPTFHRCASTARAFIEFAISGTHEVIEEIVDAMPHLIWVNREQQYIFHLAVTNRCETVFNLIYQMRDLKKRFTVLRDDSGNSILHLAGELAPPHKLHLVSGAALQMQREIQWFKEVEKFLTPDLKQSLNKNKETPAMVFSKTHKDLVKEGEKWMKDTANSCTIVAALIVTIVFAAAITVPGGTDNNKGLPVFSNKPAFAIFFISDAVSLFSSTTSLLMFLSILTARYEERDFLYDLPRKLIIGLITLFLSTSSMMIAFCATIYLVFGQGQGWFVIPVAALACLPITSFATLQFPLLVDLISSTYGRGIFGKQSDRPFY